MHARYKNDFLKRWDNKFIVVVNIFEKSLYNILKVNATVIDIIYAGKNSINKYYFLDV